MAVITLLTDFGTQDEYVGVMKGVILAIDPQAIIIDVTHEIDPQDVIQGAYILDAAADYFPDGTIHLAVVDPGVGSSRRAVAVRRGRHSFIAPDNGILTQILAKGIDTAFQIENDSWFRKPVSTTFHGRDVFAPVAAYLSAGHGIEQVGPLISPDELARAYPPINEALAADSLVGCVVAIDRFGNLLTNISARSLKILGARYPNKDLAVRVGTRVIPKISGTYSEAQADSLLALIGSRGYLEISANFSNAAEKTGAVKGDRVVAAPFDNLVIISPP